MTLQKGRSQGLQNGCGIARALTAGLECRNTFGQGQQRILRSEDDESLDKTFSWTWIGKGDILDWLYWKDLTALILVRWADLVCKWLWLRPGRSSPWLPLWLRKGSMEHRKLAKTKDQAKGGTKTTICSFRVYSSIFIWGKKIYKKYREEKIKDH